MAGDNLLTYYSAEGLWLNRCELLSAVLGAVKNIRICTEILYYIRC